MSKFIMVLSVIVGLLVLGPIGAVVGGVLCWLVQTVKK